MQWLSQVPFRLFPSIQPLLPRGKSILHSSVPSDRFLISPIYNRLIFPNLTVTRLHLGSHTLQSACSSLPPIAEFVRWLQTSIASLLCTSDYIADRHLRWVTSFSYLESKELNLARYIFSKPRSAKADEPRQSRGEAICSEGASRVKRGTSLIITRSFALLRMTLRVRLLRSPDKSGSLAMTVVPIMSSSNGVY
jgi:hypothetical protein